MATNEELKILKCKHAFKDNPSTPEMFCVNCGLTRNVGYESLCKELTLSGTPADGTYVKVDSSTPAIKFDGDKLRYDLLPARALNDLVLIYTFGAKKYNDRNWEKGMSYGRIFAATMRHCWLWFAGEDLDSESGLHHMAHAAFGCLALVEYHYTNKGEDDRPYGS